MSISGSLSNAMSGLSSMSRIAESVSSNVANAMTEGYGRREVILEHRSMAGFGGGVRVSGILRHVDPTLLANRRLADASLGSVGPTTAFLESIERAIGLPNEPSSLTARMSNFGANLIQAASRPDSEARLQSSVDAARSVATHLNSVSDQIQQQRMDADQSIAHAVDFINSSLQQISDLNSQILRTDGTVDRVSALADHRQTLVDGIADYLPIREVSRDNGTTAIFTTGGAILLDGTAAELGFEQSGLITPHMNIDANTLSGLTVNGRAVSTDPDRGPIAGGKLSALFDVRDTQATNMQTRLDAVARDLVERFEDPTVDPSLGVGDPGLFTDNGSALNVMDEVGLAGRISLNALADPEQGGAAWRLRDGMGALTPGSAGDSTLLNALSDALTESRLPATGSFVVAHSSTGLASDLLSGVSVSLLNKQSEQSFAQANTEVLTSMELENGVDTDVEMQKLLLVEQAFAANARVIQTVDELIQSLLRI